ncbi:hypothetical protein M501DRAFT_932592, partial [Patellaria atrata CBS 101060]
YPASCHCGNIAYTVTLYPSLSTYRVNVCTCSFCTKSGYMLVYPRRADVLFHLPSPESVLGLREYRFGNGVFRHLSCGRCASSIGFDPRGRWEGNDCLGLNARMFKDIEMDKLKYQYFDGKNLL